MQPSQQRERPTKTWRRLTVRPSHAPRPRLTPVRCVHESSSQLLFENAGRRAGLVTVVLLPLLVAAGIWWSGGSLWWAYLDADWFVRIVALVLLLGVLIVAAREAIWRQQLHIDRHRRHYRHRWGYWPRRHERRGELDRTRLTLRVNRARDEDEFSRFSVELHLQPDSANQEPDSRSILFGSTPLYDPALALFRTVAEQLDVPADDETQALFDEEARRG